MSTGSDVRTITGQDRYGQTIAFSPDGQSLAYWDAGGALNLLDVSTGQVVRTIDVGSCSFAFSPDGHLGAAWESKAVVVVDIVSGRQVASIPVTHPFCQGPLQFAPGGHLLAIGDPTGTVTLWDPNNGNQLRTLTNGDDVRSLAFSPDGHFLITGGRHADFSGAVTLWNVDRGQQVQSLRTPSQIFSVAYSPNGQMVATSSQEGAARLWRAPSSNAVSHPSLEFGRFAGDWYKHEAGFTVHADGTVTFSLRTFLECSQAVSGPCDRMVGNQLIYGIQGSAVFSRVDGDTAYGAITKSSATAGFVVGPISMTLMPHGQARIVPSDPNDAVIFCNKQFLDSASPAEYMQWNCGA